MNLNRFELGQEVATPGALDALGASKQSSVDFLRRHLAFEHGDLDAHDHRCNRSAIHDGSRIFLAFSTSAGTKLWVITEADRSSTCLLLLSEY